MMNGICGGILGEVAGTGIVYRVLVAEWKLYGYCQPDGIPQVPRHGQVPDFVSAGVGGELRAGAGASAPGARRAGNGKDPAGGGDRVRPGPAPDPLAGEVH